MSTNSLTYRVVWEPQLLKNTAMLRVTTLMRIGRTLWCHEFDGDVHVGTYQFYADNIPLGALSQLFTAEEVWVRTAIAANPRTPPETLQILAEDEYWDVRRNVGRNPNSTEICRRLVMMTNDRQENDKQTAK